MASFKSIVKKAVKTVKKAIPKEIKSVAEAAVLPIVAPTAIAAQNPELTLAAAGAYFGIPPGTFSGLFGGAVPQPSGTATNPGAAPTFDPHAWLAAANAARLAQATPAPSPAKPIRSETLLIVGAALLVLFFVLKGK